MTFFTLTVNDFFGGGVLLLKDHSEASKKTDETKIKSTKFDDFGTLSVVSFPDLIYPDCGLSRCGSYADGPATNQLFPRAHPKRDLCSNLEGIYA
jgi:hypothetical protein